jgi:hypothetical protein
MTKEQKEASAKAGEVISEKPLEFEIDVKPQGNFEAWLIKHKIKPSKRLFLIKPQRVGNVYRIASRAVSIDLKGLNPETNITISQGVHVIMDLMSRHGEDIFYIVAAAIQNDHREPTKKMIDFVKQQLEMADIFKILVYAISNYNIQSFMNSIVLIVGVNDLNVNDKNQASPQV